MKKSLKSQNQKYLLIFIFVHLAIFISYIANGHISFHDIGSTWDILIEPKKIYITVMPIVAYVMNGLLSSNLKAILVFWKYKNPLPACEAFSKYAYKDPRIDIIALEKQYKQIPESPLEQNRLWYSIFKKHDNNTVIRDSHKIFLLMRDITAIHVLLTILQVLYMIVAKNISSTYAVALILTYLLLALSAKNYGERFVCNVLAIESSTITRRVIK